jgi:hypothetical protein
MKQLFIGIVLLLLSACSTVVRVPSSATAVALSQALQGYGAVLQKHVNNDGEVDFSGLRDDPSSAGLPALEAYVQAIALTDIKAAPTANARLAHMINAYNALSMYNVIAAGIPQTHAGVAKVSFFVLRKFVIGGQELSLYSFENDMIRKLNEPRIHFALNCSAISCPILPRVPFSGDNLDAELDNETKAFFSRPTNLLVDHKSQTIFFNQILQFYTEDFTPAHAPSLIAYVQRYTSTPLPVSYKVDFVPYDWTVANSRRAAASK